MQSQDALSFSELVLNASLLVQCVMLFLLALSILSWTIIVSRNAQYRQGRLRADDFEERFWSGIDLNNLYQDCMKRPEDLVGLEVIYSAGFKEFVRLVNSGPADQDVVMDGTYRQMKVACSREVELLENKLPTLATIGSISPYIGLFGTVWGIMHAFVSLAAVKNATLSMVAPPIAEALIATAMGLFAAIPAVMFYNRFVTKVEALENRYYNFMDEFSTILNRRLVTIRSQMQRQGVMPMGTPGMGMTPPVGTPLSQASAPTPHAAAPHGTSALKTFVEHNTAEKSFTYEEPKQAEAPAPRVSQQPSGVRSLGARFMKSVGRDQKAAHMQQSQNAQAAASAAAPQQAQAQMMQQALQAQQQAEMRMNQPFRGAVPPRAKNPNANQGAAQGPVYRTGPEVDQRFSRNSRTPDEEPHYITPGAQRRPAAEEKKTPRA